MLSNACGLRHRLLSKHMRICRLCSPSFISHSVAAFPCQILLKILKESITTVRDVVRLAGVCTAFRRMLRQAPLRVRLPNSPGRPVSLRNARGAIACLRHRTPGAPCSTLQGLVETSPCLADFVHCASDLCLQCSCSCGSRDWISDTGLVELDVSGLPLEDSDLASLLGAFLRLRVLHLTGCQKLSPSAAGLLLPTPRPGADRDAGAGTRRQRQNAEDKTAPGDRDMPRDSEAGGHRQRKAHRPAAAGKADGGGSNAGGGGSPAAGGGTGRPEAGLVAGAAAGRPSSAAIPTPALSVVDLQRCYQLHAGALTSLLAARLGGSGGGGSSGGLSAALLSHLTLDAWPPSSRGCPAEAADDAQAADGVKRPASEEPVLHERLGACALHEHGGLVAEPRAATPAIKTAPWSGLRILALHNCVFLAPAGLRVSCAERLVA